MPLQIANPVVVAKVEKLARARGMTKTALVEEAVDLLAGKSAVKNDFKARMDAILVQMDKIPDRPDAFDPLDWDEHGLPV